MLSVIEYGLTLPFLLPTLFYDSAPDMGVKYCGERECLSVGVSASISPELQV